MFTSLRRLIVRTAIGKGVLGDSRVWLVVAAAIGVQRVVRRLAGSGPLTLYSEELGPHDRLLISAVDPAS